MSLTIDASVFVAAARPSEPQHGESLAFLDALAQQFSLTLYCPTLTLTETVAAIARRTGDAALAQQAIRQIESFPGMTLVALTQARARRAARFAAVHRLRGAEAVYGAVAAERGATRSPGTPRCGNAEWEPFRR